MSSNSSAEQAPGYYLDPHCAAWCTLPWPGDRALPYSHPARVALLPASIGLQVIRWAEGNLIHALTGLPWRFTQGQRRFLMLWYAVDVRTGRWLYRRGVKRGAKGTGKDHLMAAWMLCELMGPVRIKGFNPLTGQPIGEAHRMPLVQAAANSEKQAKKVHRIANAMISDALAEMYGIDKGLTETKLASGGLMECLTSSEESAEGDPPTAAGVNESHHMKASNGGHKMFQVVRRNVGKSPRDQQARMLEFTNGHEQGGDAIAEKSYLAWQAQQSGKGKYKKDILYDSIEALPGLNIYDTQARRDGLKAAYSDAPWADLERLDDEVLDPDMSVSEALRYYFNILAANEEAWVEPRKWDAMGDSTIRVADGEAVALFLDCSKSQDSTALIGCRLSDLHVFTIGVWQHPPTDMRKPGEPWRAPRGEVDTAVRDTFQRLNVWWFGVDPSPATEDSSEANYWLPLIDTWHQDLGKKLRIWATPGLKGHSVKFDMRLSQPGGAERNRIFVAMTEQLAEIIDAESGPKFTHDNDPTLKLHVHHARRHPTRWGVSLGKANRDSDRLVDAAVTMVGARLGCQIVLNSGKYRAGTRRRPAKAVVFS